MTKDEVFHTRKRTTHYYSKYSKHYIYNDKAG
jgi:hypothetical protein